METAYNVSERSANALSAFLSANFFVGLFSAGALQYLWGLINVLQVIVMTDLFKVDVAPNAHMIMVAILEMVSLDFIDTEDFLTELFDFRETAAFETKIDEETGDSTSKFEAAGYESANFILLLGPIFFVIIFSVSIVILRALAKLACRPCSDNCLK